MKRKIECVFFLVEDGVKTIESNLLKDTQNEPVSFFFWHPLRFDGVCALSFSNGELPNFLRLAFTLAMWVCSFTQ